MRKTMQSVLFAVLWLVLAGCAGVTGLAPNQPAAGLVKSEQLRNTAPSVAPADMATLSTGNSAFAFDLYQALRKKDGNLFYSPYSISLALAMTYAGARGETAQQMATTLHLTLPPERLHPAFDLLDLQLAQREQGAKGTDGKGFRLNIVNAIWGQQGYQFLPDFLDTLAENYGAGLRVLDFQKAAEPARVTINNWVDAQTEGKIKNLIPPGAIDAMTRLVLTNAIYFNAAWAQPFDKNATADGPFTLLDGSQVTVPISSFGLAETLRDLGMRDAFSPGTADFSGMTGNRDLFIGAVIHKAYVSVDEAGTEAAAATAVIMKASAMPAEPVKVNVDRPFIFLIRDTQEKTL